MGALEEAWVVGELEDRVGLEETEQDELDAGSGSGSVPDATRAIEEAVRVLLQGLGEDHEREGLRKTPLRVAKAFREGTRGLSSLPTPVGSVIQRGSVYCVLAVCFIPESWDL